MKKDLSEAFVTLIIGIGIWIYSGWVFTLGWRWFVMALFDAAPALPVAAGVAAVAVLSMARSDGSRDREPWEAVGIGAARAMVTHAGFWAAHLWM